MSTGLDRSADHAISEKNIKKSIDDISDEYGDYSIERVHEALTLFQDQFEGSDLSEEIRFCYDEGAGHDLSEGGRTNASWYISTYDYVILEDLTYNPGHMMEMAFDDETGIPDDDGLQRCIWGAHEYQAKELVESRDLKRITGQKPRIGNCTAVLQKSYAWIGGESLPSREEGFLLNIGLSPTEIMDYRAVEHGHRTTVQSWAEKRDEPQRKIVENIDRAKEKLHSHFE